MSHAILVPLDGSSLAERALPFAQILGEASGAHALLLRAVPAPAFTVGYSITEQAKAMREAETYLAGVVTRVSHPSTVETATFAGEPAASIFEEIRVRQVDLVVMSTHGRSGLGRWIYGSVADQIMRLAPVPVLLIPAASSANWPTDRSLRILVPLDGSELAQEALASTEKLARTLHAEIQLLQVRVPLTYTYADPAAYLIDNLQIEAENAHRYLETVATDLRTHGLKVTTFEAIGPAARLIAATAKEQGSDVIAMSTHGSGGVTRLLMGSVATGVVQRASIPILIVRPEAARVLVATPATGASAQPIGVGT
jgi:nucleotide-binding universal stress UspA family protein